MRAKVRTFITLDEASKRISQFINALPLGVEELPVSKALGRVIAQSAEARVDVPPFDRSTVDGYAVRSQDVAYASEGKPVLLKVIGQVCIGGVPTVKVLPKTAVKISTGAMLPEGADSVVMLERTRLQDDTVTILKATYPGENVLRRGKDIRAGSTLIEKGCTIEPHHIALLSAAGVYKILVRERTSIAVVSIGNELLEPGSKLEAGKIYDTNRIVLKALAESYGCKVVDLGIVPDNAESISRALRQGLEQSHIVITSGSTSVGAEDVLFQILSTLGKPGIIVEGLTTKPGMPTMVAAVQNKLVFSLPGHPTSAILTFHTLVAPFLRQLIGIGARSRLEKALAAARIFAVKGRRTFAPVKLRRERGQVKAYPLPLETASLLALKEADGFACIPENREFIDEGEEVEVLIK